jgi:hypothetical protein
MAHRWKQTPQQDTGMTQTAASRTQHDGSISDAPEDKDSSSWTQVTRKTRHITRRAKRDKRTRNDHNPCVHLAADDNYDDNDSEDTDAETTTTRTASTSSRSTHTKHDETSSDTDDSTPDLNCPPNHAARALEPLTGQTTTQKQNRQTGQTQRAHRQRLEYTAIPPTLIRFPTLDPTICEQCGQQNTRWTQEETMVTLTFALTRNAQASTQPWEDTRQALTTITGLSRTASDTAQQALQAAGIKRHHHAGDLTYTTTPRACGWKQYNASSMHRTHNATAWSRVRPGQVARRNQSIIYKPKHRTQTKHNTPTQAPQPTPPATLPKQHITHQRGLPGNHWTKHLMRALCTGQAFEWQEPTEPTCGWKAAREAGIWTEQTETYLPHLSVRQAKHLTRTHQRTGENAVLTAVAVTINRRTYTDQPRADQFLHLDTEKRHWTLQRATKHTRHWKKPTLTKLHQYAGTSTTEAQQEEELKAMDVDREGDEAEPAPASVPQADDGTVEDAGAPQEDAAPRDGERQSTKASTRESEAEQQSATGQRHGRPARPDSPYERKAPLPHPRCDGHPSQWHQDEPLPDTEEEAPEQTKSPNTDQYEKVILQFPRTRPNFDLQPLTTITGPPTWEGDGWARRPIRTPDRATGTDTQRVWWHCPLHGLWKASANAGNANTPLCATHPPYHVHTIPPTHPDRSRRTHRTVTALNNDHVLFQVEIELLIDTRYTFDADPNETQRCILTCDIIQTIALWTHTYHHTQRMWHKALTTPINRTRWYPTYEAIPFLYTQPAEAWQGPMPDLEELLRHATQEEQPTGAATQVPTQAEPSDTQETQASAATHPHEEQRGGEHIPRSTTRDQDTTTQPPDLKPDPTHQEPAQEDNEEANEEEPTSTTRDRPPCFSPSPSTTAVDRRPAEPQETQAGPEERPPEVWETEFRKFLKEAGCPTDLNIKFDPPVQLSTKAGDTPWHCALKEPRPPVNPETNNHREAWKYLGWHVTDRASIIGILRDRALRGKPWEEGGAAWSLLRRVLRLSQVGARSPHSGHQDV